MDTSKLLVISGPSGIGKTFLTEVLIKYGFWPILMTMTRDPKPNEIPGVDYERINLQDLEAQRYLGDLFMINSFFNNIYAVRHSAIQKIWHQGLIPVALIYIEVIDQFYAHYPQTKSVYLHPTDPELIRRRLLARDGNLDRFPYVAKELLLIHEIEYRRYYNNLITVDDDDIQPTISTIRKLMKV